VVGWRKGSRIGAGLGWDGMGWVQRRQWGTTAAHAAHVGGAGDCTEVRTGSESSGERESTPQMVGRRARGQDESGVGDGEQLQRVLLRTVVLGARQLALRDSICP
jgi:hypothetical protein